MRTAITILTWNRLSSLKKLLHTIEVHHPDIDRRRIFIFNNGSVDKTPEWLAESGFQFSSADGNKGAQAGKFSAWSMAVDAGYDYQIFLEDDNRCRRPIPFEMLEKWMDDHSEVGYVKISQKGYLNRHQITRMPVARKPREKLSGGFGIQISDYHFTCNPIMFRSSLPQQIRYCLDPGEWQGPENWKEFAYFKGRSDVPDRAIERSLKSFGIREKEYMKYYLRAYKWQAQLYPACFHTRLDTPRPKGWSN